MRESQNELCFGGVQISLSRPMVNPEVNPEVAPEKASEKPGKASEKPE